MLDNPGNDKYRIVSTSVVAAVAALGIFYRWALLLFLMWEEEQLQLCVISLKKPALSSLF